jgi:hypothetical protein
MGPMRRSSWTVLLPWTIEKASVQIFESWHMNLSHGATSLMLLNWIVALLV